VAISPERLSAGGLGAIASSFPALYSSPRSAELNPNYGDVRVLELPDSFYEEAKVCRR